MNRAQDWNQKPQRRLLNGHHRTDTPGPDWTREEGEMQSDSKLEACVWCCVLGMARHERTGVPVAWGLRVSSCWMEPTWKGNLGSRLRGVVCHCNV